MLIVLNKNKTSCRKIFGFYIEKQEIKAKTSVSTDIHLGSYNTSERCKEIIEEMIQHMETYSMLQTYRMPEK